MTDKSDGRVSAAQDATKKTPEELAAWAVEKKARRQLPAICRAAGVRSESRRLGEPGRNRRDSGRRRSRRQRGFRRSRLASSIALTH